MDQDSAPLPSEGLRIAAVIPTVNRPDALLRVVRSLREQTRPVSQIVISAPTLDGVPQEVCDAVGVDVVTGFRGASRQRNAAVDRLARDTDIVIFLDDDSLAREDLVESHATVFEDSNVIAVTGRMACDGAASRVEHTPEDMAAALAASHSLDAQTEQYPAGSLYGCNMAIRYQAILDTPFDEALPLYSWLEDLDVARRLQRLGAVVYDSRCVVAHQGNNSGGRTQHVRFGYSTVANAVHLRRKGSLTRRDLVKLIGRPVAGNLRGLVIRHSREAALARLRGQSLACADLLRGRVTPERITTL